MRAAVYIDGFNLYYGIRAMMRARGAGELRWLDILELSRKLLPRDDIVVVRYFTALVEDRPDEPGAAARQRAYLRALGTLPAVELHFGTFRTRRVRLPRSNPKAGEPRTVEVLRTEEKGSDVNLATYLLLDGFQDRYDVAAVVTNDSDLVEPIRVVQEHLRKEVFVVTPQPPMVNELRRVTTRVRDLRPGVVARCQLPVPVIDAQGREIRPPSTWGPIPRRL